MNIEKSNTMKNTIIFIFIITAILFNSCEEYLEIDNLTQRSQDNFYKNEQDFFEAVVAVYDVLQWNASNIFSGTFQYHSFEVLSDVLSDDCYPGGENSSDRVTYIPMDEGRADPASADMRAEWIRYYKGIFRANSVIDNIDDVDFDSKPTFIGEARFLRAYFYFNLVRWFANIPLVLSSELSSEQYKKMKQADPAVVYNQIAADLYSAGENLPESYSSDHLGRATKWAAKALLLRVYLYHKDYGKNVLNISGDLTFTADDGSTVTINSQKAQEIADDIITNSGHELVAFDSLFSHTNENNAESVFEIQFTESGRWTNWSNLNGSDGNWLIQFRGMRIGAGEGGDATGEYYHGWSYGMVTQSLHDEYDANDPRLGLSIFNAEDTVAADPNFSYYDGAYQNTGLFINKFLATTDIAIDGANARLNWRTNFAPIRYADVLLMAAEINLYDDLTKAQNYYETLVSFRRGGAFTIPTLTSDVAGLDLITRERRIEFAGEGLRYWDQLRRGLDYTEQTINATNLGGEFTSGFNKKTLGLMPIPDAELDLVSGDVDWVQNPGYN